MTLQGGQTEQKDKSSMYQYSQSKRDEWSERWKWLDDGTFFFCFSLAIFQQICVAENRRQKLSGLVIEKKVKQCSTH